MAPTSNEQFMELVYASKLLAKTIDEVDEKLANAIDKIEGHQEQLAILKDLVSTVDKKLELLPLVLAGKLEDLVDKRARQAFEDIRTTLDELRNKLYAIRKEQKQIREQTGQHLLPPKNAVEKPDDEVLSVRKGKFRFDLPWDEKTNKVIRTIIYALLSVAGVGTATGGIWALVDRLKHLFHGG